MRKRHVLGQTLERLEQEGVRLEQRALRWLVTRPVAHASNPL